MVKVMAWYQTGNKSLSKPKLIKILIPHGIVMPKQVKIMLCHPFKVEIWSELITRHDISVQFSHKKMFLGFMRIFLPQYVATPCGKTHVYNLIKYDIKLHWMMCTKMRNYMIFQCRKFRYCAIYIPLCHSLLFEVPWYFWDVVGI